MKEIQLFPFAFYLIVVSCVVLLTFFSLVHRDIFSGILAIFLFLIVIFFSYMTIAIGKDDLIVSFGLFGWPRWKIARNEVLQCEIIKFRPLFDFGGWGIRKFHGGLGLIARGPDGIRLILHDGRQYVISAQRGEAICNLIRGRR